MKILSALLFACWAVLAVNGRATPNMKPRIANRGEVAYNGEFPYQASLQLGSQHICGGALISKKHVLTAAHCVEPFVKVGSFPEPFLVELGSTRIFGGVKYEVERVAYYGKYEGETLQNIAPNDVAVITLKKSVKISDKIAPIGLPAPTTPLPEGTEVIVSGFGKADVKGSTSPVLKKMDATITSFEECDNYYAASMHRTLTSDKICAAKERGYGACEGDSGGPLVDKSKKTVVGIVSAGDGQCSNGSPDTYTDVSQFIDFINEELKYDPKNPSANKNPAIKGDSVASTNPSPFFPEDSPFTGQIVDPNNAFSNDPVSNYPFNLPPQYLPNSFDFQQPGQGIIIPDQQQLFPIDSLWHIGQPQTFVGYAKKSN